MMFLRKSLFCIVQVLSVVTCIVIVPIAAQYDQYNLPDRATHYDGYEKQCGYKSKCHGDNSCPNLAEFSEMEKDAFIKAVAELLGNDEKSQNSCYLIGESEFDFRFFQTRPIDSSEDLHVRRTLTTDKFLKMLAQKFSKSEVRNLLEGKCYANASLSCCSGAEKIPCNPEDPYRSYDGSCNNLQHPTWGRMGNELKHPIAPCFSDVVSSPARSKSGKPLPQNRKLIVELAEHLNKYGPKTSSTLNMFFMFFLEQVSSDMIGRANKRTKHATQGFRGCRADGLDRSAFVSPLAHPLRVLAGDPYYDQTGTSCLNFSPQEKANDRCELKHVGERNLESSYLDMSSFYGLHPEYDAEGRLKQYHCGTSAAIATASPVAAQFVAISGLFGHLHNYCVARVGSCERSKGFVEERCRALTIGVYQKLIYDHALPLLFGEELYDLCGLDCEYNPYVESSVSQAYKNGPGRFAHIWIPDKMAYKAPKGGQTDWLPFNVFFRNHDQFECSGILAGALESPIQTDRLVDASVNKFYTDDGTRGTCLPCIDLARNRDSGLCPLVTYKHFIEQRFGDVAKGGGKCYNSFEDLSDMFEPGIRNLLAQHYEHPSDVDLLLAMLDKRRYKGASLPKLVSQSTCLEFKRLKCTDRFFYSWNPNLGEGARHLIEILDFTALLALFGGMEQVPLEPFLVDSPKVEASKVRKYLESVEHLFRQV